MTERLSCTATITLSVILLSVTFIVKTGVFLSIRHCCANLIFLLIESISGVPAQETRDEEIKISHWSHLGVRTHTSAPA